MADDVNVEFGTCSAKKTSKTDSEGDEELKKSDLKEKVLSGYLYFKEHRADSKHIPFMLASHDIGAKEVTYKMFDDWKLKIPKIIMFVIAETEESPSEEYRNLSRMLTKGLVRALNTTEMWLCADGLNYGFSRDLGRAFENQISRRKTEKSMQGTGTSFKDTALIGICRKEKLTFSNKFETIQESEEEEKSKEEEATTKDEKTEKSDINKRYGYFIFLEDNTEEKKGVSNFLLNFASHMRMVGKHEDPNLNARSPNRPKTPVMALLLHGKINQLDLVFGLLKQRVPLVVFEGSGGIADLIAYAYQQTAYRSEDINIAEYTEAVLKPQVSDMMHKTYPDLKDNKIKNLTEKLFNCIHCSKQRDQEFITVLDLNDFDVSPNSIPHHFLKALFKSQTFEDAEDRDQQKKDLILAMDWNSADVAKEKVFSRDDCKLQIENEMFLRALTKPHREDFVHLFLSEKFVIHTFLNSANLLKLFRSSLSREFFKTVVWEGILGFGASSEKIRRPFVDDSLTILIEELTGIPSLVNSYELDWNYREMYEGLTTEEAERKAVAVLVIWAALSYRLKLVKIIWRHSEQPIHLALACSIILKKLLMYVTEMSVRGEMGKEAKIFSKMASGVMTLCHDNVPCRAIDLLQEKNRVWSYKDLMEMAAFSKNKIFLAHPSCQKYLDKIFMGNIKIRDMAIGDFTMPLWLKITLSAFFLFPILLWVKFEAPVQKELPDKKISSSTLSLRSLKRVAQKFRFLNQLYDFYSAPITKFWVCQVFYILFLICFSLAVIWPACGNVYLDFFSCLWLATIIIDSTYHAYTLNMKYTSMPLVYKCIEISLMILFLFGYATGRLIYQDTFISHYNAKVMMCLALLYFYYRLIFIALPISSDLGPMLYRVKRMVTVDFFSYIRVTILVIISNGIAIHAVVFPDYPLSWDLCRRMFYKAIISFWLTPADDWGDPGESCIGLQRHDNKLSFYGYDPDQCKVGRYFQDSCPNPGIWPYLFGLQYLMLLRMVLLVMLFALFTNTTRKLTDEGEFIWKYQRYELVTDFSNRLTLPPPLSIITLIFLLLRNLLRWCYRNTNRYVLKTFKIKAFDQKPNEEQKLDKHDFEYWKNLANQYHLEMEKDKAEDTDTTGKMKHINALSFEVNEQRRSIRSVNGHLHELQLRIANAHQYLKGPGLQMNVLERILAKKVPQIFSRMSPYPNTPIPRFPISDYHVPWKCAWTSYNPISYTLPKELHPPSIQEHVDVDIQEMNEDFQMPNFSWNKIYRTPVGLSIDRQSWIPDKSTFNEKFQYELDSENLPKNPRGRTGLRGRGCLPRWGPNHYIYAIITRWSEKNEHSIFQKYLDIILVPENGRLCLPGKYVPQDSKEKYQVLSTIFKTEGTWKDADDMIEFFESYVKEKLASKFGLGKSKEKEKESKENETKDESKVADFTAERVKLGYMDDNANTDQAWREAEIWHYHYDGETNVNEAFKTEVAWHLLCNEIFEKMPIGQASTVHSTAMAMKAVLEVI